MAQSILTEIGKPPSTQANKKGGQIALPASGCAWLNLPGNMPESLAARVRPGRGHLRIRLRNADVSADGVLADFVDDDLFGNVRA